MSWKPEVFVENKWSRNGLVFATKEEAEDNAKELMYRWVSVCDSRAVEVSDAEFPVNYQWINRKLKYIGEGE